MPVDLATVSCRLGSHLALDGVDLQIAAGERVAVVGPNGAGKSTLLRAVLGLVPFEGRIVVDGAEAADRRAWRQRRRIVALVPQRPASGRFPLLVDELLQWSGSVGHARRAAEQLGVAELGSRALSTLSGGQLQRVYLARGLGQVAAGAQVLLADEPTSALDFATRDLVVSVLTQVPATCLIVTHDARLAAGADRVMEMAAGRLRETAP